MGGEVAMTEVTASRWETKRTNESRQIEDVLKQGFQQADAYRYNSASIRVRVIDPKFNGIDIDERDRLVEPYLAKLPEEIQGDIITLLLLTPEEFSDPDVGYRFHLINREFDDPSPSML